ncbi:putative membrane protein [Wolbachia pipientis wVitA]|nr:putative membrane protein [Wolbachia pipientis wVitA]
MILPLFIFILSFTFVTRSILFMFLFHADNYILNTIIFSKI